MKRKLIDVCKVNATDAFGGISDFAQDCRNAVVELLNAQPTIDPLYALGACYCRECLHHNKSSCPAYDAPFNRTSLRIEYCNCGERKQDEILG